jgi:RNA polymerase sigma-70 factor (ECF subfamily)
VSGATWRKLLGQRIAPDAPTIGIIEAKNLSEHVSTSPIAARVSVREVVSFEQVYDTHFEFVWRYVMNRGVPRSAVDDVVQEVFIVVARKLPAFEGRSSLRTWLSAIVRRVARDHVRKRGNAPVGEPLSDLEVSHLKSPAEALDDKAAARRLDDLLSRMTEIQRDVFILHEIEQMTGLEIAEALDVNENTIHTRLRAARRIFESGIERYRAGEMKERPWWKK